jgi:hypothetical protein
MVNRVSGQFVNGEDHVFGPVFRQPGLTGMGPYARSQRVERAGIEGQIQNRDGWSASRVVIGHSLRQASPRVRAGWYRDHPGAPAC